MSPEAQRIAIAEACGWTKIGDWVGLRGPHGHKPGLPFGCLSKVPDYLNDLNAMHDAEKVLVQMGGGNRSVLAPPAPHERFMVELARIVENDWCHENAPLRNCFAAVHASPQRRAEAFLRAIGKWTDSPAARPQPSDDKEGIKID